MRRPVALLPIALLLDCGAPEEPRRYDANAALAAHSAEFEREVIEVTDGVHVAVGFGLANSILLEGRDGAVVVDTMESMEAAAEVLAAFREVTALPIRALIYTHNHTDHVFGSAAFVEPGAASPRVYAHETTEYYIDRIANVIRPAIYRRSMRMFGNYLPDGAVLNCGIGPFLKTGHGGGTLGLLRPTDTFSDRLELEVAGLRLELVHAPGETNDQLFVWLPDKRVLLPGDNFYRAFPNLYTIRGTLYRDLLQWVASLDAMRARRPAFLVPSHTRPLAGEAEIQAALTDYRDAIQFVHDQTIRGINRGISRDEIARGLELPAHLAASPFLQPFYGTVEWSSRAVFDGYLGWFDGNAAHLEPVAPGERAQRMAALAAEARPLPEAARRALEDGDAAWAAELADLALLDHPDDAEARRTLADALRRLGEAHPSANGRHYYLTQALEVEGAVEIEGPDPSEVPEGLLRGLPMAGILQSLAVNLDPEASADVDQALLLRFTDLGEEWTVHVRRGVAAVHRGTTERADVTLTLDSMLWKDLLSGRRNAALTLASGDVEVEGGTLDLVAFLRLFRPS